MWPVTARYHWITERNKYATIRPPRTTNAKYGQSLYSYGNCKWDYAVHSAQYLPRYSRRMAAPSGGSNIKECRWVFSRFNVFHVTSLRSCYIDVIRGHCCILDYSCTNMAPGHADWEPVGTMPHPRLLQVDTHAKTPDWQTDLTWTGP